MAQFLQNFSDHNKLRGKSSANGASHRCTPAPFQIKENIHLGYVSNTDVFELYLKDYKNNSFLTASNNNALVSSINETICYTIAVALRHGLTKALGINVEEIGVMVKKVRNKNLQQDPIFTICLYDTNSGGSGFSSLAPQFLEEMFKEGKKLLECSNDCSSACESCLLQFDTKKHTRQLNRHLGNKFLNDDFINRLGLPENEKILGEETKYCVYDLSKELNFRSTQPGEKLKFFFDGTLEDWNLNETLVRKRIIDYLNKFSSIEIWLTENLYDELDEYAKKDLYGFLSISDKVCLKTYIINQNVASNIICIIDGYNHSTTYATRNNATVKANEKWGDTGDYILVKSDSYKFSISGNSVIKDDLLPQNEPNSLDLELSYQLNGEILAFGKNFWQLIKENAAFLQSLVDEEVISVQYTDRYLASPLTVILLSEIIKNIPFLKSSNNGLSIHTLELKDNYSHHYNHYRGIHKGWYSEEEASRTDFTKAIFKPDNVSVNLESNNQNISHARILTISFSNNQKLTIRLDQGVGYWYIDGRPPAFPFDENTAMQLAWIGDRLSDLSIKNAHKLPTFISCKLE